MNRINRAEKAKQLMAFDAQYTGIIAGIDEVGRGPLAGDVVTACVVMPKEPVLIWVDDSKKLSETRRELVYEEIMQHALYVGIGRCSPADIDRINILEATREAMRRAAAEVPADIFLIDAVKGLGLKGQEIPMIRGDAVSYAIAAASIVAKVTRDREMRQLDSLYPQYGFARNKGYGTAEHIAALKKYGPCEIHRKTFIGHFLQANQDQPLPDGG
jgi:ribonuclease HII